jgi:hypothetical protein
LLKITRLAITAQTHQPGPSQSPEDEKPDAAGERCEVNEQQCGPAIAVADQIVAPGQARDDDDRERDHADGAVDKDRIGRRAPACAGTCDEPEPHRVAADRGWQRLVEEGPDQVETHCLPGPQRRAALLADLAPPQHPGENLKECH